MRSRRFFVACSLAIVASTALPLSARAAWPPTGVRVAQDSNDEAFPVLAADGHGGAIIAWQEFGHIFAQRVMADGGISPEWPASTGLEICRGFDGRPYGQSGERIVSDGSGGAFILWHDDRNSGCQSYCFDEPKELFVTRITPDAKIAPGWPSAGVAVGSSPWWMMFSAGDLSPRASDFNTVMVSDGNGGAIVAWEAGLVSTGAAVTIHAQRISAAGDLMWGARGVAACASPGAHWYPAIASDGQAGAFIVWQDGRQTAGLRLYGQHVSAAGECLWSPDGVRMTHGDTGDERAQVVTSDGRGGLYVAWEAAGAVVTRSFAQHVRESGALDWHEDAPAAGTSGAQSNPGVMADRSGALWLTWIDGREPGNAGVFVQQFDKQGRPAPEWPENGASVGGPTLAARSNPRLVTDQKSGAYVTWLDGRYYPRATRISHRGAIDDAWPNGGAHLSDSQFGDHQFKIIPDEFSGAIVSWSEGRPPYGGYSMVLAQRLSPEGMGIEPTSRRFAKRFGREVNVGSDAARAPDLELGGFLPNPVSRSIAVAFSLPDGSPAKLELFDLAGRLWASRDIGALGGGRHVVDLGAGRTLPAGLYLIRLTRGDHVLVARGAVIR